ncbi:B-cell receptor CD22-like [Haliotis rubra]|uniref:B-cell receptor CD22-like n=1 Tax=Haliotis rubra TaxID=36100 RepID=UPI001EE50274|nr:B-cell receptor CD22-like [Haliotis rubra]
MASEKLQDYTVDGFHATTTATVHTLRIHLEPPGSVLNVLLGQSISLVCMVDYSNTPVTSFNWTHSGRSYSGQTFSKTITSKSDSGNLACTVQNVMVSTRINVWYPPEVHLEPSTDTITVGVGEDLRVQCVVDDASPSVHTFRWSHNGRTSTGSTFLKRNVTKSDQGQLTCTADNGHMMTPGRAAATINMKLDASSLIGNDDSTSKFKVIAIATGSVGLAITIILIILIICQRRKMRTAKPIENPER